MVTRRFSLFALACFATAMLAGCDDVPLFAPIGSEITLIPDTTTVTTSGSTRIVARVIEPSGTPPHPGTRLAFLTTLGAIQPSTADTDDDGFAVVTFLAGGVTGSATVRATSGGSTAGDLTITIAAP